MGELRFDNRVVIVTGAGAGLGKAYALLFASKGAKVVVNDLGGSRHGDGNSTKAADLVVDEIKRNGGIAVPDYNSVVEGEKIIRTALENFGRVDVLVNNAGILRDKSFASISDKDWDSIQDVHLKGAFKTSQAAWPHFKKQKYGRIIMTSSNSGLYGNFGQANYSAAKMGLVGLCNTMAIEGRKYNINCNVIVPTAASRLTEDILPPDLFAELKPELIAPVVVWLCHEDCEDTSSVVESAAGWATKYKLVRGPGSLLRSKITDSVSPEDVKNKWDKVTDLTKFESCDSIQEASASLMTYLEQLRDGDSSQESSDQSEFEFNDKTCILYSLAIGTSVLDESNLQFLYENHENFSAFPTHAIIPGLMAVMSSGKTTQAIPGKTFDLSQVLHGEQYLELLKPIPTNGKVFSDLTISEVLDKGKHAVIVTDVNTQDESGEVVCKAQITTFVLNGGGFGGKSKSTVSIPTVEPPKRSPDFSIREQIPYNQAALYRLTGDINPLHIDPNFAMASGFSKPILHGLCSLGFSARHVLSKYGGNNPAAFKAIKARFSKPVYPGETIVVDMWQEGARIHFKTSSVESNSVVITGAYIDLNPDCISIPTSNTVSQSSSSCQSDVVFDMMKDGLKREKDVCKKVNGVFLYNITKDGDVATSWTLDLKTGNGDVYRGTPKNGLKADTTITISDQDMLDIAQGKLNPQSAFMKGKMKIKGNIMLVQKLKPFLSSSPKI